jgi:anti-anti-sigma factor
MAPNGPTVEPLESTVATIEGVPRAVWLLGEHDIVTDPELADTIARAISLDDRDLVLDLSKVEFMGASTVGVIVGCRELLRDRSRSLTIRAPSGPARRILDVCRLAALVDAGFAGSTARGGALSTWVDVPKADRHEPDLSPAAAPTPADASLLPARRGP